MQITCKTSSLDLLNIAQLQRHGQPLTLSALQRSDQVIKRAADAVKLGISRALMQFNAELRGKLKSEGLVTRDSRGKERKKYGQKGARKRFQFSKR